jgi:large subunit ribosomal protein L34
LLIASQFVILRLMEKMNLKASKIKRKRKHGFLTRMKTNDGQKMLKRRRDQGRERLAV